MNDYIKNVAGNFSFEGELTGIEPVSIGLINDSYILSCSNNEKTIRYLLQRINNYVFKNPENVMHNIVAVTEFLNDKAKQANTFNPETSIYVIPTKDGKSFYISEENEYFRAYNYVQNTYSIDAVTKPEDAFNAGRAFGRFIYDLKDIESDSLCVTIPDFHNTKKRYSNLLEAIKKDEFDRLKDVRDEVRIIDQIKDDAFIITEKFENGSIPSRVIHNDTKINNVLFDCNTHDVVCVVDLDTIMSGSFLHDFGDAITTGASKEIDGKLLLDLDFYESYVKGFFSSCIDMLTADEIALMPLAAKTLAFEVMTRFLADYLSGDVYFKTQYKEQNLERTRQELSLVLDIMEKMDEMKDITKACAEEYGR
ncbi:MAG: phosphotransferase [Clostridia bacterium]|nr:phosphotransferase [Clostridia bacterium]